MGTMPSRRCAGAALFVLATPLAAQVTWHLVPASESPPARHNHCSTYDVGRNRLVIHGGSIPAHVFADTWEFDGASWQHVVAPVSPGPRWAAAMAYDPTTGTTILFGGSGAPGGAPSAETWRWDGTTWTLLQPAQSPPGLVAHAMAADFANNRVVLFGGRNGQNEEVAQTWTFDGATWTQLPGPQPPSRCCHDLAYHASTGRIVLFGGWDNVYLDDTWELSGSAWLQRTPPVAPAPRWGHRMTWSPQLGQVLLHGGKLLSSVSGETWTWNGSTWQAVPLGPPGPRLRNHVVHAQSNGIALIFGGSDYTYTESDELRTLAITNPGAYVSSGAGCAGPLGTPVLEGAGFPWIGTGAVLRAAPVPMLGIFVLGWSNTFSGSLPLPLALGPIGMPGCILHTSLDVVVAVAAGPGATAQLGIPLPLQPALVGVTLHAQVASLDPAANALGLTTSNTVAVVVGGT